MTFNEGDCITHNGWYGEIVGQTSQGYDIVRYYDQKVVRGVTPEQLQLIENVAFAR